MNAGIGISEYDDAGLMLFSWSAFFQVSSYYRLEWGQMHAISGREGLNAKQRDRTAWFVGVSFPGISDQIRNLMGR